MKKLFNFILAIVCTTMVAKAISSPEPTVVDCGDQLEIKATPETGWHFVEWDDHNTENPRKLTPEDNGAYQAIFAIDQHTIKFKNYDGTTLQSSDWDYGTLPEYNGATPEKPSTAEYNYTFSGWEPVIVVVTQSATYAAQFTETARTYPVEITPEDGEGGEGGTVTVEPDGTPVAIGDPITLTAKADPCYEFVQWSNGATDNPLNINVTESMIADGKVKLKAQFQKLRYTILFNNWDGTNLDTQHDVLCGYYPVYTGPKPTKPEDATYSYTFNGWFTKPAHKDTTYTASFSHTYKTYPTDITVDGGEDGEVSVEPADQPVGIGETITLTAKAKECYEFVQWSNGETKNPLSITVSEDMLVGGKVTLTLKAQFEKIAYTINFNNWSGANLQTGSVLCGDMPEYTGVEPNRPMDAVYTYLFKGWDKPVTAAKSDETYTAVYTEAINRSIDTTVYMATFVGKVYNDGTPVTPITVEGSHDYTLDYYKTIAGQLYHYTGILRVVDVREWDVDAGAPIHGCDAGENRSVDLPWMSNPVQVTLVNQPFPPAATSTASYGYDNAICKLNYHYKMIPVDTVYENVPVHGIEEFPLKLTGGYTYDWPADEAPNRAWTKKGIAVCEPCGSLETPAPGRKSHQAPGLSTHDIMHILSISYEPVKPAIHVSEMIEICQGDTFMFRDSIPFYERGVFFDTLLNHMGIDSINMIIVNVYPTYEFEETASLHNKRDYTWVGHKDPITGADWIIKEAGVYIDSLKTIHGCDSIYELTVTNQPLWEVIEDTIVCKDATPIEWRGRLLYNTGIYADSIHFGLEADTIYQLNLTVRDTRDTVINATICEDEYYIFAGQSLTKSGFYHDTLLTALGCDSIVHLVLNVMPKYDEYIAKEIVEGESFTWRGKEYTDAGHYYETVPSAYGCDSTLHLELTVWPNHYSYLLDTICESDTYYEWEGKKIDVRGESLIIDSIVIKDIHGAKDVKVLELVVNHISTHYEAITLCQGESYTRDGRLYTAPGLHHDTLISSAGCDSIVTLYLQWTPAYMIEEEKTVNGNADFMWHGQHITGAGTYLDSHSTVYGCDSTYRLTVTVNPTYRLDTTVSVCSEKELPYVWQGNEYYNTGVYEVLKTTVAGADSILSLHLTVNEPAFTSQSIYLCQGDSFTMGDSVWKEPGIYYDTLITSNGCDSIVEVIINRGNSYHYDSIATIYSDESFMWHGQLIQNPGLYYDNQISATGCDSTYTLTVTKKITEITIDKETICESELPYTWAFNGRKFYGEGHFADTVFDGESHIEIRELQLTVNATGYSEQQAFICQGESYTFFDTDYSVQGTYTHHLLTEHGCDSTIVLHLNVMNGYAFHEEKTINANSLPYHWQNRDLYASGEYSAEYKTIHEACDSIYTLKLTVHATYADTVRKTVCANELPFEWEGTKYYTAGEYDKYYQTVEGKQDSTIHLSLTVSGSQVVTKSIRLCRGEFFELNGQHITTSGVYDDTIPNMLGCDSITRYILEFAPAQVHETEATVCQGSSYIWHRGDHETAVTRQGSYFDTIRSERGCDSILYRLRLTWSKPFMQREADTICQPEAMTYTYHGKYLDNTEVGLHIIRDEYNTIHGCDSIYEMAVLVRKQQTITEQDINLCYGETYTFRGVQYTMTDSRVFEDTLQGETVCDSIVRYNVHVHPKYLFEETHTLCAGDAYEWQGRTIEAQGHYTAAYRTAMGCDSIYTLTVNIAPTYTFPTVAIVEPDSLPYVWREKKYWTSVQDADSFITALGCDSVYTLDLTVAQYVSADSTILFCEGSEVWLNGRIYTTPGRYSQWILRPGKSSPDSLFRFTLVAAPVYHTYDSIVACDSEFKHNGIVYNYNDVLDIVHKKDSVYTLHLTSQYGCDSIVELHFGYRHAPEVNRVINICQGDAYTFRGVTYTTPTSFEDTLKTIDGCDSVVHYFLNVHPTHFFSEVAEMNKSGHYVWKGHLGDAPLTKPGVYWDSLHTAVTNCDSIYRLTLLERHGFLQIEDTALCSSEKIKWHNQWIKENGVYFDSLKNPLTGADSVYVLNVTVQPADTIYLERQICQGEFITFGSQTLRRSGTYVDYDPTGCGTYTILTLIVNPTYLFYEHLRIDEAQTPYLWHNQFLRTSGEYTDSLQTVGSQCDSVYVLKLDVTPAPKVDYIEVSICQGDAFEFRGEQHYITERTVFTDTLLTRYGTDSLVKYVVNVWPTFHFIEHRTLCGNEYYPWHGMNLHEAGVYYDRNTTTHGCDSTYEIHVTVAEAYNEKEEVLILKEEFPYEWRGRLFWKDTVQVDSFRTVSGCDSLFTLDLKVCNKYNDPIDSSYHMCPGTTITVSGHEYTHGGFYQLYYATGESNRPDSIYRFYIHEQKDIRSFDSILVCESEFENGIVYHYNYGNGIFDITSKQAQVYEIPTQSMFGCDSIVELHFGVIPTKFTTVPLTVYEGTPVWFHGKWNAVTEKGIIYDTLYTSMGCDSIVKYVINIQAPIIEPEHVYMVSLCSGDSLILRAPDGGSYTVTMPGVYEEKLIARDGTDSIIRYVVNRELSYTINDTITLERGESYQWGGTIITNAGDYRIEEKTAAGCDSIANLHVIVDNTYRSEERVTVCYEERPYLWRGQQFYETGIYYDSIHSDFAGDSVFRLDLTVREEIELTRVEAKLCYGDVFYIRNQRIDEAGIFYDTLTSKLTGCDSVIMYIVNEYPTFLYEETHMICDGSSFYWSHTGKTYDREGIYCDTLPTIHGCDSVFRLVLKSSKYTAVDTTIVWCWDDLPYRHFDGHKYTYYNEDFFRANGEIYTFRDTLTSQAGCDSIINTRIVLTNKCNHVLDTIYFCHGDTTPAIISGQKIDKAGVYFFNEWSFDGYSAKLDSVHRTLAIEARTYEFSDSYIACQGDKTEVLDGFIPGSYAPGEHDIKWYLKTIHGCDSIYNIHLTVYPSYHHLESNHQIRDFDVEQVVFKDYEGNDVTFTLDGSQCRIGQYDTLLVRKTDHGCEETFNVTLTVVPTKYETKEVRICVYDLPFTYQSYDKTTYMMQTVEAWDAGVYRAEYYRPGGNVSIVTTYTLYVDGETILADAWIDPNNCRCQQKKNEVPEVYIDFSYTGAKPSEYNLEFSQNALNEGFVNVIGGKITQPGVIRLPWPSFSQSTHYVRPDQYYVNFTLTNGACTTMQTNTIQIPFTALYPAWITESLFDHTIAILNENYNDGYIFSNYSWFVNGSNIATSLPYIYDPDNVTIQNGDTYYVELTRMGENYAIATCPKVYVQDSPATGKPRLLVKSSPAQVHTVRMQGYNDGEYYIYSQSGSLIRSGVFHEGETDIELPETCGCYLIRMIPSEGEQNAEKAMIY